MDMYVTRKDKRGKQTTMYFKYRQSAVEYKKLCLRYGYEIKDNIK